jgi:carboxylate-amine ligase
VHLRTAQEYEIYVNAMVRAGAIPDASYLWWAMRPSHFHPTLELRATDCCTRLDDTLALAALFRVMARHLFLKPDFGTDLDGVELALAQENLWRAQRYGVEAEFVTLHGAIPVREALDELLQRTQEDAEALGCVELLQHCRTIARRGTSADIQLAVYEANLRDSPRDALKAVSTWVCGETLRFDPQDHRSVPSMRGHAALPATAP